MLITIIHFFVVPSSTNWPKDPSRVSDTTGRLFCYINVLWRGQWQSTKSLVYCCGY